MSPAAELLRRLDAEATGGPWRRVDNRNNHWGMRDVEGPGVGGHLLVGFTIATDVDAAQRVRIEGDAKCIATTRNLLPLLAGLVEVAGDVVATLDALSRAEPHQKLYAAKVSVGAHEVLRKRLAALEAAAAKEGE